MAPPFDSRFSDQQLDNILDSEEPGYWLLFFGTERLRRVLQEKSQLYSKRQWNACAAELFVRYFLTGCDDGRPPGNFLKEQFQPKVLTEFKDTTINRHSGEYTELDNWGQHFWTAEIEPRVESKVRERLSALFSYVDGFIPVFQTDEPGNAFFLPFHLDLKKESISICAKTSTVWPRKQPLRFDDWQDAINKIPDEDAKHIHIELLCHIPDKLSCTGNSLALPVYLAMVRKRETAAHLKDGERSLPAFNQFRLISTGAFKVGVLSNVALTPKRQAFSAVFGQYACFCFPDDSPISEPRIFRPLLDRTPKGVLQAIKGVIQDMDSAHPLGEPEVPSLRKKSVATGKNCFTSLKKGVEAVSVSQETGGAPSDAAKRSTTMNQREVTKKEVSKMRADIPQIEQPVVAVVPAATQHQPDKKPLRGNEKGESMNKSNMAQEKVSDKSCDVAKDAQVTEDFVNSLIPEGEKRQAAAVQCMAGSLYASRGNWNLAIPLYRQAADKGYAPAQVALGECLLEGNGVAPDDGKAFELFQDAAKKENGHAFSHLGYCYAVGKGTEKNLKQAEKSVCQATQVFASDSYYLKACDHLCLEYLQQGKATEKDDESSNSSYARALRWLALSTTDMAEIVYKLEPNSAFGKLRDGVKYFEDDPASLPLDADEYYTVMPFDSVGASLGAVVDTSIINTLSGKLPFYFSHWQPNVLYFIGLCYMQKDNPFVPYNLSVAMQWFRAATEKGILGAKAAFGHCFFEGKMKGFSDALIVMEYLRQAATAGDRRAQYDFARGCAAGYGLPGETETTSISTWYKKSAEQEYTPAIMKLANDKIEEIALPSRGSTGTHRDDVLAEVCADFRRAAVLGSIEAENILLGVMPQL